MPGGDRLVLGTDGNLRLSLKAAEFFADHRCRMLPQPTPQAIRIDNQTKDLHHRLVAYGLPSAAGTEICCKFRTRLNPPTDGQDRTIDPAT